MPTYDGVGVTDRHADRSRVSWIQRLVSLACSLEVPLNYLPSESSLLESTSGGGSRSGLPPRTSRLKLQDARFPPEHLDGPSVSTLVFALRRELPLTPTRSSQPELRGVEPPPEREADLSTLMVPRSYPSVDARWHGIVQHRQRKPTSVRRKPTSEFETVSLSWLLYAPVYVDLPQLPTFLDPPWLLLSSHPARFDQPVVPSRTIVGLHHLHGRTSAFKNCLFGGSLPSILPSLSSWQSSALYYDCWVFRRLRRDMSFWDLSFLHCTTLTRSGEETNIVGLMVKLWGALYSQGLFLEIKPAVMISRGGE